MKPILFKVGSLNVYAYGLMMVIGFFVFLYVLYRNADRIKVEKERLVDLALYTFISGILGARLLYVLVNYAEYAKDWRLIFHFEKGGLAWHGGLLGAIICIIIYTKLAKMPFLKTFDLMSTAIPLSLAVGRIGCFLNGCCYGNPTHSSLGLTFPSHRHPEPVHPTQIYELVLDVLLFVFLYRRWDRRKFDGENALLSYGLYSLIRFVVEFFRNTSPEQMVAGLSLAQWLSLAAFIILGGIWFIMRKRKSNMESVRGIQGIQGVQGVQGIQPAIAPSIEPGMNIAQSGEPEAEIE